MTMPKNTPANPWPRGSQHTAITPGAARNTGAQLPDTIRERMERQLGADFSGVRIHTNSSVATSGAAQAYTMGRDIHFAPGQYNPSSKKCQNLLGHELTHFAQQKSGPSS